MVAFRVDGIEVQIAYSDHATLARFQLKRMRRLLGRMAQGPRNCSARIEGALSGDLAQGCAELHALEAEVIELVAVRWSGLDLAAARKRHAMFSQ